jgi:5-methylcytosine-specific restriction enzyme subunit McrC
MDVGKPGYVGRIPVRNLWLLMLYASDLYRELDGAKRTVEDNPDDIPDLVAELLTHQVEGRLKRNLTYGYQIHEVIQGRVRGRIDLLRTERHQLLDRGKVACCYEELTVNTPRNRYVRSALNKLAGIVQRDSLARQCNSLAARLRQAGVTGEHPGRSAVSLERFGRNDAQDRQMVAQAQLAFNLALPSETAGSRYLSAPDKEEVWVRKLFEKAVAGFYTVTLAETPWRVTPGVCIGWPIEHKTGGIDRILPSMRTDIILENRTEGRRLIMDTKFNRILSTGWYREETLRSGYLYQIYAYLRSQENPSDPLSISSTGVLLHPSIGSMVDETVTIQGHCIRFATVDLGGSAADMRRHLLTLVG